MELHFDATQDAFDKAFANLTASYAAGLILKRIPLSESQKKILEDAEGNYGYRLRFDPEPVGHIAFTTIQTEGCGNRGFHILTPATPECRRIVNAERRGRFAEEINAPYNVASGLFSKVRGYEPVLKAVIDLWPLLSRCPYLSDRGLRHEGFRPGHPHDREAIRVIREVLSPP